MNVTIFGCARSGTSIFGELLKELTPKYRFEPTIDNLRSSPVIKEESLKMPVSKGLRPEGLSINLEAFVDVVPNCQPVWIVRNPLDTVCSLRPQMAPRIAKGPHRHPPPLPLDEFVTDSTDPLIHAAIFWTWNNGIGYDNLESFFYDNVPVVYYENMIDDPEQFSKRVKNFFDLEGDCSKWIEKVSNTKGGYEAAIQSGWSVNDHSVRVQRYKENLTEDEIRLVKAICYDTASKFGYDLREDGSFLGDR